MRESMVTASGWTWHNVTTVDPAELARIGAELELDPYVVDDLLDMEQVPKVEVTDDRTFVVLHVLRARGDFLDTLDVYCVLDESFLLTITAEPVAPVGHVWQICEEAEGTIPADAVAMLLDVSGHRFLETAAAIEARIVALDARAVAGDPTVLPEIHTLRREETAVRRMLRPQAVAATRLAGSDLVASRPSTRRRILDAAAATERAADELSYARTMLGDLVELYRSATAEKTNEVTRVLTVYAALMLPLSIVVGFWGMNFGDLPLLRGEWGWLVVVGGMAAIAAVSWFVFRHRGYVGGPSARDLPVMLGRGVASVAAAPIRLVRPGQHDQRNGDQS